MVQRFGGQYNFYTFVPKKRELLCFQKVVRIVVTKESKYCYKNATLPICQN